MVDIKPWISIFSDSSNIYNPGIFQFMGYRRVFVWDIEGCLLYCLFSINKSLLIFHNTIENRFKRGAVELSYSFPIHELLHG